MSTLEMVRTAQGSIDIGSMIKIITTGWSRLLTVAAHPGVRRGKAEAFLLSRVDGL
jgi:hypothetical protein